VSKQASDARLRAEKRAMKHITHWIGGKPWDGEAERHGDVYDPATGQVTGQVDFAGPAEVDLAVAAAKDAFKTGAGSAWPGAPRPCSRSASWSATTPPSWPS